MVERARHVAALGLGAALVACAGLTLHRTFTPSVLPLIATALLPFGFAALWSTGGRPASLWFAAPANAVGWLLVASATVLRPHATLGVLPNAATLAAAAAGLRDSWRAVFTIVAPVSGPPELLVAAHALVWVAAAVCAETLARTKVTLPAILPAVGVLGAGLLTAVGTPGTNTAETVAFVVVAAVLLLVRQPEGARRRYLTGLPVLVAVTAVALLAPAPASRPVLDLHRYAQPASDQQAALDPLDQVSAWLSTPDSRLFTVDSASPEDWRIAVLDAFDGTTWHSTGRFAVTESRVPQPLLPGAHPVTVDQLVTVSGLTGVWLPAAAAPVEVKGTVAVVDPESGILLRPAGLAPGLTYEVTSAVPDYRPADLLAAVPAKDSAALADLSLPAGLPDAIATLAQRAVAGATYPFQEATRLESWLRGSASYDPAAPPGHSYGHLSYFLTTSHRGSSEQFATAFAVMARSLGLPTRVAVGFRPGLPTGPREWQVRGTDALVWPEVDFQGLGWVPFFPTPGTATSSTGALAPAGSSSQRQQIDAGINAAAPPAPVPAARPGGAATVHKGPSYAPLWTVSAALVSLGVGYLLIVLILPAWRTFRRRTTPDGTAMVALAWREALYRLRPAGIGDVAALTTVEVAARAGLLLDRRAAESVWRLGALADAAAFAGVPLGARAGVEAWWHVSAIRAGVRHAVRARTRLLHRLRPSALRG
jgi:transglutaminase-like putative cysteine protease